MPPLLALGEQGSAHSQASVVERLNVLKRAFEWTMGGGRQRADSFLYVMGDRVVLRDKSVGDIEADYVWRRDPELARLDGTEPLQMSLPDYRRLVRGELRSRNRESRRFGIETRDGRYIGTCMYYDVDERRSEAELGIMIGDREYWGSGLGTDAVSTLLDYVFTSTGLGRVFLHTLSWNSRARRCFSKAGFAEVRGVRRNGLDYVRMEISREEWEHCRVVMTDAQDAGAMDSSVAAEVDLRRPSGAEPIA